MSTAIRVESPPLVEGDHLDQPEFHRRYEAMPGGTKAELIDGVVSMPSPVSSDHSISHAAIIYWLFHYSASTLGVAVHDNATTVLGRRSEPQPDALLRIRPEFGGRTTIERGYIHG